MQKVLFACVCILFHLQILEGKGELPSFLKICKRTDPKLGECIKESINGLIPHSEKGIPKLKIPPFNPFRIPEAVLDNGNLKLVFKNIDCKHIHHFELSRVDFDVESCRLEMDGLHPILNVQGSYSADGKILAFEIHSAGAFGANFTSNKWTSIMHCKREQKNNEEYMKFADIDMKLNIGGLSVFFADLFTDNPELANRINTALNENSQELIKDFEPLITNVISKVKLDIVQGIFDKYPIDLLLPK